VCPGSTYQVAFKARRLTSAGSITAVLYVDDTAYAGGMITSAAFVAMPVQGQFIATSSSALLRIEITYTGGTGSTKEAQIDDVVLTKTS
jgi:hypothetical protein